MTIPTDPKLLDITCVVTIRLRGHVSYKGEDGALKALRRRAPGHPPDEYRSAFEFLLTVYGWAVAAIPRHPSHRPEKASNLAEVEDFDHDACVKSTRASLPPKSDRPALMDEH